MSRPNDEVTPQGQQFGGEIPEANDKAFDIFILPDSTKDNAGGDTGIKRQQSYGGDFAETTGMDTGKSLKGNDKDSIWTPEERKAFEEQEEKDFAKWEKDHEWLTKDEEHHQQKKEKREIIHTPSLTTETPRHDADAVDQKIPNLPATPTTTDESTTCVQMTLEQRATLMLLDRDFKGLGELIASFEDRKEAPTIGESIGFTGLFDQAIENGVSSFLGIPDAWEKFKFSESRKNKKGKWQDSNGHNYCVEWATIKCNQSTHYVKLRILPKTTNVMGKFKFASTYHTMPIVNIPPDPIWNRCYSLLNPVTLALSLANFAKPPYVWKTIPGPCMFVPLGHWKGECNLYDSSLGNLAVNIMPAFLKPCYWESKNIGGYLEAQGLTQDCTLSCLFGGEFSITECGQDATPVPYNAITGLVGPDLFSCLHNLFGVLGNHVGLAGGVLVAAADSFVTGFEDGWEAGLTQFGIALVATAAGAAGGKAMSKLGGRLNLGESGLAKKIKGSKFLKGPVYDKATKIFDGASGLGLRLEMEKLGGRIDKLPFDKHLERLLFPKLRKAIGSEGAGSTTQTASEGGGGGPEVRRTMDENPTDIMDRAKELDGKIKKTQADNERLTIQNEGFEEDIATSNKKIDNLESKKNRTPNNGDGSTPTRKDRDKTSTDLHNEAEDYKNNVNTHNQTIKDLDKEYVKNKKDIKNNNENIEKKQARNTQIDNEIEVKRQKKIKEIDQEIENKKEQKRNEINQLQERVNREQAEIDRQKEQLRRKVKEEQAQIDKEVEELKGVKKVYEDAGDTDAAGKVDEKIEAKKNEKPASQEAYEKKQNEKPASQGELENAQNDQQYKSDIQSLENEKKGYVEKKDDSMKKLKNYDELTKEKERNNEEIEQLQENNRKLEERQKNIPGEKKEAKTKRDKEQKNYDITKKQESEALKKEKKQAAKDKNNEKITQNKTRDKYDENVTELTGLTSEHPTIKQYLLERYWMDTPIPFLEQIPPYLKSVAETILRAVLPSKEEKPEIDDNACKEIFNGRLEEMRKNPCYVSKPSPAIEIK